ncbi:MAG: hypothetical protein CMP10_04030 [Zetaproteobacteria bacterium]|nr:hypothetical protein [Pseudobdellovibrionaceae bacterium]
MPIFPKLKTYTKDIKNYPKELSNTYGKKGGSIISKVSATFFIALAKTPWESDVMDGVKISKKYLSKTKKATAKQETVAAGVTDAN